MGVSFLLSYLFGLIFFAGTLYWFVHVTTLGAVLLVIYFAVYFGLFGLANSFIQDKPSSLKTLFLSSFWVLTEYGRAHLFTGFGWVLLGQSQFQNLVMIQIADALGVYGVSFLIMMVNITVFELMVKRDAQRISKIIILTVTLLLLTLSYGMHRLNQPLIGEKFSVSVIQANIPQELKWHKSSWPDIMQKYKVITRRAALEDPDLLIWPETAFPGYLGEHDELFEELKRFVDEINIPLLLGVVVKEGEHRYFNSAVLISKSGAILDRYDKLHLVPFGEYIPFRTIFPSLSEIIPIADFNEGKQFTLFSYPEQEHRRFATLICFEDSLSYLSRAFVKKGAKLLVNITNDAWFEDTKAPFMHLQASVFRSIENRRMLIRAANTGVSGFVDPYGKMISTVADESGKQTYVLGFKKQDVILTHQETLYTKYGDFFSYFCFIFVAVILFTERRSKNTHALER